MKNKKNSPIKKFLRTNWQNKGSRQMTFVGRLVLVGLAATLGGAARDRKLRIVYVVTTWWPRIDGGSIAAAGHVRYFVEQGHPTLVVAPAATRTMASQEGQDPDPLATLDPQLARSVVFGTDLEGRADGNEYQFDPFGFAEAEAAMMDWKPDVLLVMDPDYFLFDTFRIPGFNSLVFRGTATRPATIAAMTTFMVDGGVNIGAVPPWAKGVCEQGAAFAYHHFDQVFANAAPSARYLEATFGVKDDTIWIVKGNGVSRDFCERPSLDICLQDVRAARSLRQRPEGTLAFVYVGRLSADKAFAALLDAFVRAVERLDRPRVCLYVVGYGELEGLVLEVAAKYPEHVIFLGQLAQSHVGCVLRQADAYVTPAPNETYGRSVAEALRCSLPVIAMASCNVLVADELNGLLADNFEHFVDQMVRVIRDPTLLPRLAANVKRESNDHAHDPNARMLQAVIEAYEATTSSVARPFPRHWLWGGVIMISVFIDDPRAATHRIFTSHFGKSFLIVLISAWLWRKSSRHVNAHPS